MLSGSLPSKPVQSDALDLLYRANKVQLTSSPALFVYHFDVHIFLEFIIISTSATSEITYL